MEQNLNNVIGPIDKRTWNALRLYRSSLTYHTNVHNDKVVRMVKPIYKELMNSIK